MSQLFASGGQSIKSFRISISPSNDYSGLISFRMNWLDLLAVQDSQESSPTPQFKSINCLALSFLYSLSHPYMTTGKTIADKVRRTFAGKVMSLLFNMLSRLVITFLPRSKHLLVSWLQSPSAVILEPPKLNTFTELKQDLKWALGSMATNKASEGDGNPVELFQILKDDVIKVLHSICQQKQDQELTVAQT